jgi:transcription antitermination factor NusG
MGHQKKRPRPDFHGHGRALLETKVPAPADLDLGADWYLVYTAPRMEAKVAKGLADAGCKVFLPAIHRVITQRYRRLEHDVATFPRYLFTAGVPFRWRGRDFVGEDGVSVVTVDGRPVVDIRDIDGVIDVVGTPRGWLKVPGKAVGAVAAFQNDYVAPCSNVLAPPKPRRLLAAGERVKVIDGPFASFQATVVDMIGLERAEVLVDIFGRSTPLDIDLRQLDAA